MIRSCAAAFQSAAIVGQDLMRLTLALDAIPQHRWSVDPCRARDGDI
ncbi:MAG: hypothetical protein OXG65_06585 [Chloroflexi bacterium]|nr:hypothetical protein [Chloroflexota bacterium]